LQSVTLSEVPAPTEKMPSGYGVTLHFSDNLQTSDNLKISDFLQTTEPNDKAVVAHVSMMQNILYHLYRTFELMAFYYIYRNNKVVLFKDERRSSSFRRSITHKTKDTPDIPFYTEVNRIVNRIFIVSGLTFDTKILTETPNQVRIQMLPYMGGIDTEDKILSSLSSFLKKVEDSDIMLDNTSTTITLTLHDKIKLTQWVDTTYCKELLQFLRLMDILCTVCTTTIRKKNADMSVKYTIPQGIRHSLHKSVKSCNLSLDAAAQIAADAPLDVATAAHSTAEGGDGRRPLRKHARKTNRKHNRKTRHKHSRKTRHKRTHRSRTARKHKKYSRRH
jgi:hypothetical protein